MRVKTKYKHGKPRRDMGDRKKVENGVPRRVSENGDLGSRSHDVNGGILETGLEQEVRVIRLRGNEPSRGHGRSSKLPYPGT